MAAAAITCSGACGTELGEGRLWLDDGGYSCEERLATGECGGEES